MPVKFSGDLPEIMVNPSKIMVNNSDLPLKKKGWFTKNREFHGDGSRGIESGAKNYLRTLINKHKQFVNQWSWPKESWFFTAIWEKSFGNFFQAPYTLQV